MADNPLRYEPTLTTPTTIDEMRFWTTNELRAISATTTQLSEAIEGGITPPPAPETYTPNFVEAGIAGTFPFATFYKVYMTCPAMVIDDDDPTIKFSGHIWCATADARIRINENRNGAGVVAVKELPSFSGFLGTGIRPWNYTWKSTGLVAGDSVVFEIWALTSAAVTESTDGFVWAEEF